MDIIQFKESFDPNGDRCILVKEIPIPELVPGYPDGPAYDFFYFDAKGKGGQGEALLLNADSLRMLYKHISKKKDRIFVWHYLRELAGGFKANFDRE